MLVIISDLHLSDNSLTPTTSAGAFHLFRERLTELATRASWRSENLYKPVQCVDIVLLGDTLDLINSDLWLKNDVRPWFRQDSRQLLETVSQVVDRTLQANRTAAGMLRSLSKSSALQIPVSPAGSSASHETDTRAVPVQIHYMVGEHDWPLHLRGSGYDLIRQKVIQYLGLNQAFDASFPHQSVESPMLHDALSAHRVVAAHGETADPFSFHGDRGASCLSNVLTIDVLQRFVLETIESAGSGLPEKLKTELISLLDSVNSFEAAARLRQLIQRSIASKALRRKYERNWNALLENALQLVAVNNETLVVPENVRAAACDLLQLGNRGEHVQSALQYAESLNACLCGQAVEKSLEEDHLRFIVYGHSHRVESLAIGSIAHRENVVEQFYFNCGSWRAATPAAYGKSITCQPQQQIAFHAFYRDDERCGRPFEIWQGTLAAEPFDCRTVDCDESVTSIRAMRSLAKASALSRPHFLDPGPPSQNQSRAVNTAGEYGTAGG